MRSVKRLIVLAALAGASMSCGDVARTGRSPVYLVIDSLQGIRGAATGGATPSSVLDSDVLTLVTSGGGCTVPSPCPTVFEDNGTVTLRVSFKDLSGTGLPAGPSTNNDVTITGFHVVYARTDGRNTQGVDVPYAFDGAATGTVSGTSSTDAALTFELVRTDAKNEAPLVQLRTTNQILTTIATVTFYGHDQVGNDISVTGTLTVNFGDFGDF